MVSTESLVYNESLHSKRKFCFLVDVLIIGIIPVCLRDIESQLTDEEALVLEMEGQQSEDSSYCSSGSQLEM